ncbi:alpha/beta hydrolase family protein [Mesonia aestuariivivens]|uniref:Alpha/beta fold hydrolase n=1 Tax=Mesonia aestuariivivens TaxID=2796128 RepID=A0ABS6W3J4_9FLAO|nr:alpha/beta fold hydrolase [Mesonia aestuariivivens]MBW2962066.1 alpha/beta fold hydrolase [Mesonia aestuariivivens]
MKKLLLILLLFTCQLSFTQSIEGDWKGSLNVQGTTLPTVFHIEKIDSSYTATMDSPKQNAFGIPLDEVKLTDNHLSITHAAAQLSYEATLVDDTHLEGTFEQRGFSISLNLEKFSTEEKQTSAVKPNRPQTPMAPYAYRVEEVTFYNPKAKINLAGTLTIPQGKGKFPAVILISGSGPQDRNEEIFNHQPFKVLADHLTKNGIAVLRYDDRGTAASEGDFASATTFDFTDDAQAAIEYLKSRKEINKKKIGAIGHSEGGAIAPILASKNILDFIVLMAAPGLRGDLLLNLQRKKQEELLGINPEATQKRLDIFSEVYEVILDTSLTSEATEQQTLAVFEKHWKGMVPESKLAQINEQHNSEWLKTFIRFDPSPYLQKVNSGVLALNGEKDTQVPAKENLAAIEKSVQQSSEKLTLKSYPKLNHLFQEATTGSVQEYEEIEQTISPKVLADISTWILETTR